MSGRGLQRTLTDSLIEMPLRKDGDVDWTTLGNILTAHNLGEVLCASYVDQKYGKKNPGFDADTDWKLAYTEHGVIVLRKDIPGSPIQCFMGRTIINLPVQEISNFIDKPESAFHWNKYIVDARKLKILLETDTTRQTICYTRHEATQCLFKAKRDFVFYHHISNMNGKCVHSYLSVDYPGSPKFPGVKRAQLLAGSGVVLEPYNGDKSRTLVSYLIHTDLAGLPVLITNRVLKRQPVSLYYLQEHLMKAKGNHTPDIARKSISSIRSNPTVDSSISFMESNPLYHDFYSPVVSEGLPSYDSKHGFFPNELSNAPILRPSHTPGWYSDFSSQDEGATRNDVYQNAPPSSTRGSSALLAKQNLLLSFEESQSVLEFGACCCSQSPPVGGISGCEADGYRTCDSLEGARYCTGGTDYTPGTSPRSEACEYTHVKKLLGLVRIEDLKNVEVLDDTDSQCFYSHHSDLSTGGELSPKWSSLSSLVSGE